MTSILQSAALLPVEQLVNKIIDMDPVSRERLNRFDGRVMAVTSRYPSLTTYLLFGAERLRLSSAWDGIPDAVVTGSATDLLRQLFTASKSPSLMTPGIEVRGDSEFVQDFYRVLGDLDPDWLQPLAMILGEPAAQQASDLVNRGSDFSRQSSRRFRENLDDYLHEESGMLPTKAELESHRTHLDELRLHLDRLDARRRRLAEHLSRLESAGEKSAPSSSA